MKVVINSCHGCFGISSLAFVELIKREAKCLNKTFQKNTTVVENHGKNVWAFLFFNNLIATNGWLCEKVCL